jgi:hypothetical protein
VSLIFHVNMMESNLALSLKTLEISERIKAATTNS